MASHLLAFIGNRNEVAAGCKIEREESSKKEKEVQIGGGSISSGATVKMGLSDKICLSSDHSL